MKGLYVYGALLQALCFAAGGLLGSNLVMAAAIISCALAALCEAVRELVFVMGAELRGIANILAVLSWLTTALAACSAILALMEI